jgi:hypothetical protein
LINFERHGKSGLKQEEEMPPRTIDNLGVEVSTRYAEDRSKLDETLVHEAQAIPIQTEIEVTIPFLSSELEALLQAQPTYISWAFFNAPLHYAEQRKRLFTYQLIPSMGSEDKKESQAQKILAKLHSLSEKKVEKDKEEKNKRQRYEEERALEEEEKEKKVLTSLLDTIAIYDKLIIDINSRRSQYQKG